MVHDTEEVIMKEIKTRFNNSMSQFDKKINESAEENKKEDINKVWRAFKSDIEQI